MNLLESITGASQSQDFSITVFIVNTLYLSKPKKDFKTIRVIFLSQMDLTLLLRGILYNWACCTQSLFSISLFPWETGYLL